MLFIYLSSYYTTDRPTASLIDGLIPLLQKELPRQPAGGEPGGTQRGRGEEDREQPGPGRRRRQLKARRQL